MLRFLRIRRLAVIDSVEVEFDPGLNVLTGETGAGKSILVEAVGLLLGGRASADLVRTGEDSAIIEALFEHQGREILVRREITAQGRSRAYINGELATAGALKDLASRLIELHGQHEHQTLLDPAMHLPLVDAFGALDRLVESVTAAFERLAISRQELARLRKAIADRDARLDLVKFQLAELDRAAIQAGEDDQLAATRQVLASAERIERLCSEAYALLYEEDQAVLASLGHVWRRVGELATLDPQWQPYVDAKDGIKAQLDDMAGYLRRYADGIDASPQALQQAEERLALLERLKRKHGPLLADVIAKRESLRLELADLEGGDERIAELERTHAAAREEYQREARALSGERRRVAIDLARQLEAAVAGLALDSTRAEVRFGAELGESQWTAAGLDQAEFFISTNPGEELRPLAKIVSGGELSRIMLAIKALTSGNRHALADAAGRVPGSEAPGLIFDEVDAGIGGRVADVVGRRLRALGASSQVLCITHLPQIAAYADTHFQIVKRVEAGRTLTSVSRLDDAARVDEIGRMLGGEAITAGLRASAEEMLASRRGPSPSGGAKAGGAKGEGAPKGESESATRRKRTVK